MYRHECDKIGSNTYKIGADLVILMVFPIKSISFSDTHCDLNLNASENAIKMDTFLLAIFDEIWPMTMYYSTGSLARFLSNFKNS